jgi:1-deoxy-D-xylulose-5-phosphate synthase
MRFVKPLDREAILSAAHDHSCLVTVEENAIAGGAGSGVNEILLASGISIPILNIGLGDAFLQHGTRGECLRQAGLDADGILGQITHFHEAEFRQNQSPTTARHGTS